MNNFLQSDATKTDSLNIISGFSEPVYGAQVVFRQTLLAMSEPGTVCSLVEHRFSFIDELEQSSMYSTAYAIALTLADQTTTLGISEQLYSDSCYHSIKFHTGCPIISDDALNTDTVIDFMLLGIDEIHRYQSSGSISQGDLAMPEKSTTLIVQLDKVSDRSFDQSIKLNLQGPGIETERQVYVSSLEPSLLTIFSENQRQFPLGLDVFLCSKQQFLAIPRTTRVTLLDAE
jgi:alpha-D-ribose 1-methylphosphonate 5-triphosphate synthase subunit PhnH